MPQFLARIGGDRPLPGRTPKMTTWNPRANELFWKALEAVHRGGRRDLCQGLEEARGGQGGQEGRSAARRARRCIIARSQARLHCSPLHATSATSATRQRRLAWPQPGRPCLGPCCHLLPSSSAWHRALVQTGPPRRPGRPLPASNGATCPAIPPAFRWSDRGEWVKGVIVLVVHAAAGAGPPGPADRAVFPDGVLRPVADTNAAGARRTVVRPRPLFSCPRLVAVRQSSIRGRPPARPRRPPSTRITP
jgi:hypothetical protein